ncbi:MAG: HK97 family phage prohead protease [Mycobacterium sp.]|uniref:HK97 family phage prohead protease n=1 Tax=Mycobacterium sp. TaxID=1785 RepID=UPI003CBE9E72
MSNTEIRSAAVAEVLEVDWPDRTIVTVAAPYERPAPVMGGQGFGRPGEIWSEVFCRLAFASLTKSAQLVTVNRDHDKQRTVGKVLTFRDEPAGLVAELKVAKTQLGDETLALADDGVLGASVGFAARPSDQQLDRTTKTRRIRRAYLDHLALVPDPAYREAKVLSVRSAVNPFRLDDYINDPAFTWAEQRSAEAHRRAAHASSRAVLADFRSDPVMKWAQRRLSR